MEIILKIIFLILHAFLYKQHFYKQHQAKIRKKSGKRSAATWGWTFAIWKLFIFFIHDIIQK